MNIIEIIPISRAMPFNSLLYTARTSFKIGDIVTAPFQKGSITGLVVDQHKLEDIKLAIRSLPYTLRDGLSIIKSSYMDSTTITRIRNFAKMYSVNEQDIYEFIFPMIRDRFADEFRLAKKLFSQGTLRERAEEYSNISAKYSNIIIICPSKEHSLLLSQYIPSSTAISTKTTLAKLGKQDARIIISHYEFVFELLKSTDPHNTLVIIDSIHSPLQKLRVGSGEYFNRSPIMATFLIRSGFDTMIGDELLPFGEFGFWEHSKILQVPLPDCAPESVLSRYRWNRGELEKYFLKKLINSASSGESVIIYCNQKDLYGYVLCPHCQHTERCNKCSSILRLKSIGSRQFLMCPQCHTESTARDICPECNGVTLLTRRQGIDGYANVISDISDDVLVYTLTKDTKSAKKIIQKWQELGGILITTSVIFNFPSIVAYQTYISPHTWTETPSFPEYALYEYIWLLYRSKSTLSQPITKEILSLNESSNDYVNLTARAQNELIQARQYASSLPCIFL